MADGVYRSSGGTPCPVCATPFLLGAPDQPVSCAAGCGTWYPLPALEALIEPSALTSSARHWWRHGDPRACIVCGVTMMVAGRAEATVDLCREHGLWIPAARRAAFESAFVFELVARRQWVKLPPAPPSAAVPPTLEEQVAALVRRVETLEAEVAALRARADRAPDDDR